MKRVGPKWLYTEIPLPDVTSWAAYRAIERWGFDFVYATCVLGVGSTEVLCLFDLLRDQLLEDPRLPGGFEGVVGAVILLFVLPGILLASFFAWQTGPRQWQRRIVRVQLLTLLPIVLLALLDGAQLELVD